jgi:hypothetical protein
MLDNVHHHFMANDENRRLCDTLKQDIVKWEGQNVEFMEIFPENVRELAKEIAAFATTNTGTVYIGVDDDGKIVGVRGISDFRDIKGKDEYSNRIQGITQSIDPPIRVNVNYIDNEGRVVIRIDAPKGSEPMYCFGGIPYLRDITSSRQAKAVEVKNIHLLYFQATRPASRDLRQSFITRLIDQLSDIRLLLFDYEDHLIRPDINQMLYDLGASGRILLSLSSESQAKQLGIEQQLVRVSESLDELESHQFYVGRQSVDEFGGKARSCLDLLEVLFNQVWKHARPGLMTDYARLVNTNIDALQKDWDRRKRYFERREIERLREAFRRFGFVFYRFGNYPEAESFANVGQNLRKLGEKLRNLSSVQKYFIYGLGTNPLPEIEPRFSECAQLMDAITKEIM